MKKRMLIMLILMGLAGGGLVGWQIFKGKMIEKVMAAARSPILTVSALTVEVQKWQPKLDAAGSLRAVKG
ncbi:MAG: efflux transporter periplasmic adaptor subunit, partial [Alphaproteobacteria bacterium]|nr:efflux transporter periplasmic adaptor subunit [Alphaproteobacteria bacterium]